MKNRYLLPLLLCTGLITFTSCSDFLDAENKSQVDADKYFSTAEGYENLTTSAYYSLRSIYEAEPLMFCAGTDLYDNGRNTITAAFQGYSGMMPTVSQVGDFYKNCYNGIERVNCMEHYFDASIPNASLRLAEGKFIRAYYYYLLSQQFGGVPIKTDFSTSILTGIAKSSQEDVYKFIISQLEGLVAENVLPATDNTGRVSMRAVYNLLAKTYLAYAWDYGVTATDAGLAEGEAATASSAGQALFAKAASYADQAIGTGITMTKFSDMWDVANDNNSDIIFAIQYKRGISGQDETTKGNKQMAYFGSYYSTGYELSKYTTSTYVPSLKLLYLFEPGDDRYDGTFMKELAYQYHTYYTTGLQANTDIYGYFPAWYEDMSTLTSYPTSTAGRAKAKIYSSSNPSVGVQPITNRRGEVTGYKNVEQPYETSQTGSGTSLCVRKFDDYNSKINGTNSVSFHNIVLAHVTESYLIAAEAYYMAGDVASSLARLNTVRTRSNATSLTSYASYVRHYSDGTSKSYNSGSGIANVPTQTGLDPIDIILDERARELCGEYYRWMDLRRTKRLIDYNVKYNRVVTSANDFKGADGRNKWFRPIPSDAIKLNEQTGSEAQNPGY